MSRLDRLASVAPRLALVVVLAVMARTIQQDGHGWGDDFALYVNQARGLVDGTWAQVVADNRYAMDNSAFPAFTPIAYPWGTSLLLMPIVAVWGIDWSMLKWVPTVSFVIAVLCFQRLAERRFGWLAAGTVTIMVALNPWYLWATDAVLSDLVFMAAVFAVLVALDRALERGTLLVFRHLDAIVVGALVAAAFHVRREGIGLLVAVAAAQVVARWTRDPPVTSGQDPARASEERAPMSSERGWRSMVTPWAAFALFGGIVHVMLPAPVRGNVDVAGDPGRSQILPNLAWYREPFAELTGLKRIGDEPIQAWGSAVFGAVLVWALLGAAVIGAVVAVAAALRRRRALDLHVVGATLGMGLIVMMTPYHYQRYLFTLVPLVVLLAARGIAAIAEARRWSAPGVRATVTAQIAVLALLLAPVLDVVDQTSNSLRFHSTHSYVHRGPEDTATLELWDAVRHYTDGRDVVVFFQARSMNLFTRRLSIVGNDVTMMVERGDWYAMERDSDYLQAPLTDELAAQLGFAKVWENDRYVLWDIPPRPRPWRDQSDAADAVDTSTAGRSP